MEHGERSEKMKNKLQNFLREGKKCEIPQYPYVLDNLIKRIVPLTRICTELVQDLPRASMATFRNRITALLSLYGILTCSSARNGWNSQATISLEFHAQQPKMNSITF